MILDINSENGTYSVVIQNDSLKHITEYIPFNENVKYLLVTDAGVPDEYIFTVSSQLNLTSTVILKNGEINKNLQSVSEVIKNLTEKRFCRSDCVIALGGGVVGDIAGFAASVYMRGINFINIPTTLLSQVDSSIGGKTGFDFEGHKNLIGTFYSPNKVIIDPTVTSTQTKRDFNCGLIEALKMALCFDRELFTKIVSYNNSNDLENIICRSLMIKKQIVESDENEKGSRKILNFGHTLGHAIELSEGNSLLHGECVAIGMLAVVPQEIKNNLISIYEKWNIPFDVSLNLNSIYDKVLFDKKANSCGFDVIFLHDYEKPFLKNLNQHELYKLIEEFYESRIFR